jgi:hypothetical protein
VAPKSPAVAGAAQADIDAAEEETWSVVLGSAHHRRKKFGKDKRVKEVAVIRRSDRLARKDTRDFVDTTTRAVKLRELRDTLKGCSAKLQAHVAKNKVLQKLTSPTSLKHVCSLKTAAFGKGSKKGADNVND